MTDFTQDELLTLLTLVEQGDTEHDELEQKLIDLVYNDEEA